jgi:ABC-type bacteriocin/lantibiotic exporter with double-glycine peptidase domain
MGFYELTGGKIFYGGYDLETIDMRYLRKQMGVVLQNGRLAVGDIYSNISDNDDSISHDDVMDALCNVGLEEKINALPNGIHTTLEQSPFSEGEKQRLLIARAIVKKNKFIFLDEATSSLDNISQGIILRNIKNVPATKIIIVQKISAARYCDKIIVIEKGKIAMQGTYDQIIRDMGFVVS